MGQGGEGQRFWKRHIASKGFCVGLAMVSLSGLDTTRMGCRVTGEVCTENIKGDCDFKEKSKNGIIGLINEK